VSTLESLIIALGDVEPETRAAAAEALGRERDPKAVAALVRAIFDDDSQVRMKAEAALGQTADGRGVNALIQVISEGAANC
jgi:HEAT repeat protein